MKINSSEIDINQAIDFADYGSSLLKRRDNGMLLSDYQVDVLKKNGLNYLNYGSIQTLLFDIEDILNDDYDEELDIISSQLAEYIYYKDTKK